MTTASNLSKIRVINRTSRLSRIFLRLADNSGLCKLRASHYVYDNNAKMQWDRVDECVMYDCIVIYSCRKQKVQVDKQRAYWDASYK